MKTLKKLNFRPKAVLFDMDGVIIDSMPYHFLAWYEALRPLGVRVNCLEIYLREGERWEKSLVEILTAAGLTPTRALLKRVFAARQKTMKKIFRRFVFAGAEALVACLKRRGYRLALVTGTNARTMKTILPKRIERAFDCLVTGDSVRRGKPDPEPYRKALRSLGLKASECVVVENSPLGIRSAKGAKTFCIAVTTSLPRRYLGGADIVVDTLEEIGGLLDGRCAITMRKLKKRYRSEFGVRSLECASRSG